MINKEFIQKLKKEHDESNKERRQIISLSNVILHDSKRIIFSSHRNDLESAKKSFVEIEKVIKKLEKDFTPKRIYEEGAYKAAAEEYVEAKMFYNILNGKKIDKIIGVKLSYESYLGGICDTTGELVRRAINEASRGNYDKVEEINKIINDVMASLVEFDMTGYLRTKYDQAKTNLRKIEQVNYEVRLAKRK